MPPPLSDLAFRWFSDWIRQEYGLNFGPEKRDILRSRLEPRRAALGVESFEQLFLAIRYHPDHGAERDRLIPHLTNNESYFFREPHQLRLLSEEILPQVRSSLEKENQKRLRVLSAGCAAGEEPYTLAILIDRSRLFPPPWMVRLTGIDLDPEALERARLGHYGSNAFRALDPEVRTRYFTPVDDRLEALEDRIRRQVHFRQANLLDPAWIGQVGPHEIVFCRNVLIYFDDATIQRVIDLLVQVLVPGGFLFLGHAESLSRVASPLRAIRRPGGSCYQKPALRS